MSQNISWSQSQWNSIEAHFGYNEFNIYVWGTVITSLCAYLGYGLFFTIVDVTGWPKFMQQYKVQENVKSYPISISQLIDVITVVGFNLLLTIPASMIFYTIDEWRGFPAVKQTLPSLPNALLHFVGFVLIIEVAFYYSHRLLHHPYFYKWIHKKHHTWISPIAISAAYCHPIEHVVSNVFPIVLGPILLKSHILLLWIWITISSIETLTVHSGYHLPYLESPEFHDFHHLKFNYNYGVIGLLDYLHGTDSLFRKSKQFMRHKRIFTSTPVKTSIP